MSGWLGRATLGTHLLNRVAYRLIHGTENCVPQLQSMHQSAASIASALLTPKLGPSSTAIVVTVPLSTIAAKR